MGYYAAYSGKSLGKFRDTLSVPSSRVKNQRRNYLYTLCNSPEECSTRLPCGGSLKSRSLFI